MGIYMLFYLVFSANIATGKVGIMIVTVMMAVNKIIKMALAKIIVMMMIIITVIVLKIKINITVTLTIVIPITTTTILMQMIIIK